MRSALRATAVLSSGSVVQIGVALIVSKVWAVLVGPAGVGLFGLLQSLIGIGTIVASLGVGMGMVRLGAQALGSGDERRAAALHRAALAIAWTAGALACVGIAVFRRPVAAAMLGGPEQSLGAALAGAGILCTVVSGVMTNVLNAHRRVRALATALALSSVLGAAVNVALILRFREAGIPWAVAAATAVVLVVNAAFLHREVRYSAGARPDRATRRRALQDLVSFGLPQMGSSLVGAGVMLALPLLVLHELDLDSVGFYRASLTVAAGYLGFLFTAMGQDYYPRLAAIGASPADVSRAVNDQIRLVLLVVGPLVLLAQAAAFVLVPLVYAASFAPAIPVLEWMMTGSLFRFFAWALAFVVLARNTSLAYFAVEAVGGAATLAMTWAGLRAFGLVGSGIGFFAAYVLYAAFVWVLVWRRVGVTVSPGNRLMLAGFAVASLSVHGAVAAGAPVAARALALVLGTAAAAYSARVLLPLLIGPRQAAAPSS